MTRADLLANVERSASDRPASLVPLLPDIESPSAPVHGSVTGALECWRRRALAAEAEVRSVRVELATELQRLRQEVARLKNNSGPRPPHGDPM